MTERAFLQLFLTIMLAAFGWAFAWLVVGVASNIRGHRTARYLANIHSQVLDRLATTPELLGYLEGPAGRRLFASLSLDVRSAKTRILESIQLGVVLSLLGVCLLLMLLGARDESARRTLLYLGMPTTAVGCGFLLSAWITYTLSKSWRLLDDDKSSTG